MRYKGGQNERYKFFYREVIDHVVITSHRVQPHPWKQKGSRGRVLVKRLVHVPQESDCNLSHTLPLLAVHYYRYNPGRAPNQINRISFMKKAHFADSVNAV